MRNPNSFVFLLALAFGLAIAFLDSRPGWDDTGVSALAILITSAAFSYIEHKRAWIVALLVGAWIPVYGIWTNNYGAILALGIAFLGAMIGWASARATKSEDFRTNH